MSPPPRPSRPSRARRRVCLDNRAAPPSRRRRGARRRRAPPGGCRRRQGRRATTGVRAGERAIDRADSDDADPFARLGPGALEPAQRTRGLDEHGGVERDRVRQAVDDLPEHARARVAARQRELGTRGARRIRVADLAVEAAVAGHHALADHAPPRARSSTPDKARRPRAPLVARDDRESTKPGSSSPARISRSVRQTQRAGCGREPRPARRRAPELAVTASPGRSRRLRAPAD